MTDADPKHRYFIRDGYVPNTSQSAVPEENYWNERRIESSTLFQYHVYDLVRSMLRSRPGSHVLDIGCGTARKAVALLIPNCASYTGIDQASAIAYCRSNVHSANAEFVVDNLEDPGFHPSQPYNFVLCADVIEHLTAPDKLLEFARNALGPGGSLIISTPEREVMHGQEIAHSPNPEHIREWNRAEFRQLLTAHGLRVEKLSLAPQFRIRPSKASLRLLRRQLRRPIGYWGCQVAICTKG